MPNTKLMLKSPLQSNAFLLHLKHVTHCPHQEYFTEQCWHQDRLNASEYYSSAFAFSGFFFFFFGNWSPFPCGRLQFLHHMEMQQKPV